MEKLAAHGLIDEMLNGIGVRDEGARHELRERVLSPLIEPLPDEVGTTYVLRSADSGRTHAYVIGGDSLSIVEADRWDGSDAALPAVGMTSYPLGGDWTVSCEARIQGSTRTSFEWAFYFEDRVVVELIGAVLSGDSDEAQRFALDLARHVGAREAAIRG